MPLIRYIEHNGAEHEIQVENGRSIMQGAVDNMLEGIVAECGGSCSCATCHCIVDDAWVEQLEPAGDLEQEMLDYVNERKPTSRLSCQIEVNDALNGLVVRLPETQF